MRKRTQIKDMVAQDAESCAIHSTEEAEGCSFTGMIDGEAPCFWGFDVSPPRFWGFDVSPPRFWGFDVSPPRFWGFDASPPRSNGFLTSILSSVTTLFSRCASVFAKPMLPADSFIQDHILNFGPFVLGCIAHARPGPAARAGGLSYAAMEEVCVCNITA